VTDSKAQAEQVRPVSVERIGKRIGRLPASLMAPNSTIDLNLQRRDNAKSVSLSFGSHPRRWEPARLAKSPIPPQRQLAEIDATPPTNGG
jgi:hypothetical protein